MNRTETFLALIVPGVGLVLAFVAGLWGYMSVTSAPLHPNPLAVTFVTHSRRRRGSGSAPRPSRSPRPRSACSWKEAG